MTCDITYTYNDVSVAIVGDPPNTSIQWRRQGGRPPIQGIKIPQKIGASTRQRAIQRSAIARIVAPYPVAHRRMAIAAAYSKK